MTVGEVGLTVGAAPVLRVPATPVLEWLELDRADATARFVGLTRDLSRAFDPTGAGKRITAGHAYAGLGSAAAWASVCRDPLGGAPRLSVSSFASRWRGIRAHVPAEPCHYVSLGPGDGLKDGIVLAGLTRANRDLCYLPVDTSDELLHLAVRGLIRRIGLPADRVMSLPWDFSLRESAAALRRLLDELFGATPALFSLLGNTIAQFDDDTAVLRMISRELLRPGDRLLLEVEATSALTDGRAALAADEHALSPAFGEFVISALRQHTGLPVDRECVELLGSVEGERALLMKAVYRSDEDAVMTLPNGAGVRFDLDDTVRLALSRKYSPEGLAELVVDAGLNILGDVCTGTGPFGLALLMLEREALQ
jgi:uncharacterized SAM-dependent methyltransferase